MSSQARSKVSVPNLTTLENQIEKKLNDLSSTNSKNHQLRQQINQLRREKKLIKEVQEKLTKDATKLDKKIDVKREGLQKMNKLYEDWIQINEAIIDSDNKKEELFSKGFQTL